MKKAALPFFVLLFFISTQLSAQNVVFRGPSNQGRIGISTSLGDNLPIVSFPFWLTSRFLISTDVGFSYFTKRDLDVLFGLSSRYYFRFSDLHWYFGVRFGSMILYPYNEEGLDQNIRTDLFTGLNFGLEYYASKDFSLGIQLNGDLLKSDERSLRFDNPGGIGVVLRPVFVITYYFN